MSKSQKKPKGWLIEKQQIDDLLEKASSQLAAQDYKGAERTCKRILQYVSKKDKVRAEALGMLGMAYAIQKKFEESYEALSEAVQINPEDSYLLFNRGLSARFTSRTGQSLRDFEKVRLMNMDAMVSQRIQKELEIARKVAFSEMKLRGADFSLDQLIEQQELFQQGNQLSGVSEVRSKAQGEDIADIKSATEALGQVIQSIGASVYQQSDMGSDSGQPGPQDTGPDVVDGEVKE